jgi:predicted MFS family arabinose efflux permease
MLMAGGQWIQQLTLGWLLYDMTGSAVLLGALNGLRAVPFLIAGPMAGVAADRMDRRRLLLATQPVLVITSLVMGALVVGGRAEVSHLFLFTLVSAMAWSFNQPVRQSLVPNLVPKQHLMNAVALDQSGFNVMKVLGPTLAGLLIAWFGAGGNFFVQGVAYAGVLATIYLMHVPPPPTEARQSSARENLSEGFAFVWRNRLIMTIMVVSLVPQIFAMPYIALMPVFQKDVLMVGPEGLGLLFAAPGVGAVPTMLLLASVAHRIRRSGLLLLVSLLCLGLCLILFSRTTSLPVALLILTAVGACQLTYLAAASTMLQTLVPDALRGRVTSLYMLDRGLSPIGALLAGLSAELLGAPTTLAMMGGLVILLVTTVVLRVPSLRELRT